MPDIAGDLNLLEELRLDTNHITSLPATVAHWTHLKVLTASGNSLTGEYIHTFKLCLFVMLAEPLPNAAKMFEHLQ